MENPRFLYKTQVRESHLDLLGHVNNAVYLQLFEEARWDFVTLGGYGVEAIKKKKKSPVVLEVNLKFKKELHNREKIEIHSNPLGWRGKIGQIEQIIYNEKKQVSCIGLFTIGFFDLESRKLIEVSEDFKASLE